ncbi:MAG: hypothetical protein IKZ07_00855 [Akkermansia sp.]|nr:hypothetical protein [Akkermansia sp.]
MPIADQRQQPPYRQMEFSQRATGENALSPERAREQAEKLRQQAELIEQQRQHAENQSRELEQNNMRKARFNDELNEIGTRIHNSVRRIERELESMSKEQQELELVCECFRHHLQILSVLQPEQWPTDGVAERLRDALPKLERADNDFNEAYAYGRKYRHTDVLLNRPGETAERPFKWKSLKQDMARGLAFHLPLFLLILISWLTYTLISTP